MTEAPPAEQAMHRNHVAKDVEEDVKLDASEFDGCWLVIPDHHCKFCCDTYLLVQKHVDADTVVAKSVALTLGAVCWPFHLPCICWVCPGGASIFLGLRASDADDGSKNAFDYIEGKVDASFITDRFDINGQHSALGFCEKPDYYPKEFHYAPGFESHGKRCLKSQKTELNGLNNTWRYSGGSRARLRLWNPDLDKYGLTPTWCIPELSESEAVRCAPYRCLPTAFDRDLQKLAAYYSGSRRKDDRPLTAAEQEDKEVCNATFAGALHVGNIPLLRRYRAVVGALKPEHARVLAGNGHVEALKWARDEGVEFPPGICAVAASSGKVDVLKYCKESGEPFSSDIMFNAVKSGSVECVEYCLKSLKVPWGANAIGMASKTSPEMLKYCLDNGAPEDPDAIRKACSCTDLDVVKVFAESSHPFPSTEETITLITYNARKEVCDKIEYLCAGKGYSLTYKMYVSDSY
jgi:hypothetical protein